MGLESTTEKLDSYFTRLEKGKAQKIKPTHVEKIMKKLEAKATALRSDLEVATKETKKQRLQQKIDLVSEQLDRARWLREQIAEAKKE
ncbi:hypothetical protein MUY21_13570 [Aliiroseovarius sp. S2029]|uniref:hypothetical protein n=1 Tax=Aliiroseovarius sp. S2029 TaxID=2936988 RepID=UPI0020C077EC|nr:hypothetical protein [Aliiroseovarius sp. S2029]MCK8485068.1 hypothetical protein [Aliiroseovarius sp. S2029]